MSDTPIKVFFALWPKTAERSQMVSWQASLKHLCGGRTMRGETLHNTLVFLGNVTFNRLEALQLAALEISADGFELCFDQARYWGHNHIVYAAPSDAPQHLTLLVNKLEQRLRAHRFKFDQKDYCPHVTLLRNAKWNDAPLPTMPPVSWSIGDFALVQSVPQNGFTDYQVLTRFPLGSSDG